MLATEEGEGGKESGTRKSYREETGKQCRAEYILGSEVRKSTCTQILPDL